MSKFEEYTFCDAYVKFRLASCEFYDLRKSLEDRQFKFKGKICRIICSTPYKFMYRKVGSFFFLERTMSWGDFVKGLSDGTISIV